MNTNRQLHFTIDGEWFTDQVRAFVLEEKTDVAIRLLREGVVDLPWEAVFGILRGEQRFTGNSTDGLVLEAETGERPAVQRFLKDAAYIYAGRIRKQDHWYRPYAVVIGYGSADIGGPDVTSSARHEGFTGSSRASQNSLAVARTMYYATNPQQDFAAVVMTPNDPYPRPVIFERVEAPPFWWHINSTSQDAVDDAIKNGRYLERRGMAQAAHSTFGWSDKSTDTEASTLPTTLESLAESVVGPERAAGVVAAMTNPDYDSVPVVDSDFNYRSGWILRDGRFFGCDYMGHPALAHRIFTKILGEDQPRTDPELAGETGAWVRIQDSLTGGPSIYIQGTATQPQINTIFDFCTKHKVNLPYWAGGKSQGL